jgi:hypothetical protein
MLICCFESEFTALLPSSGSIENAAPTVVLLVSVDVEICCPWLAMTGSTCLIFPAFSCHVTVYTFIIVIDALILGDNTD